MGEPKTALVLSAGGMFGAYQAGVWKAVAERFQPDIVVGASVGALNGWIIASRCPPGELIDRWKTPAKANILHMFPDPGFQNGWLDPEPLRACAEQIVEEFTPQLPLGVVVVKVRMLRTVLLRYPNITAAHLQATCSIPYFLPAVTIGGARYFDGGLLEKLPIWAAIEMGATRIVAVDSLPRVGPKWLRYSTDMIRFLKPRRWIPKGVTITTIAPSEQLGDAEAALFWSYRNIIRWVDLGYRDAEAALG
ncbi:MAG: patatin-like phospholipase family protein [Acidobacteriota bacterium]|nr:patatin-like phospholipase family protein [Acidobacteriota bacterium]